MEADALEYLARNTKGYSSADIVSLCNGLKSSISENGMDAVDKGYSEDMVLAISSKVVRDDAEKVLKTSNSSVSMTSVRELAKFEEDYNCKCAAGNIMEFMMKLS